MTLEKKAETRSGPRSPPEKGLRHRPLPTPPGSKPLGASGAGVVDDEPDSLPVEEFNQW
jgi:hypothetical protein